MNYNKHIKKDREWSKSVLESASYQCQYPDCKRAATDAHHVIKRILLDTRWDEDNGIALCRHHHNYIHNNPLIAHSLFHKKK